MNGIILAAGFSRRMGKNKLLMNIGEKAILEKVIGEIKKSDISNIILVAREDNVIELGIREEIQVIKNEFAIYGQSQSIKLGLSRADLNKDFMFFCGDQPFIDSMSINKLITESLNCEDKIIVPRVKDKTGSPVIFPKCLKRDLELLEGDIGGREVIKNNKSKVKYIDIENELFLQDIDNIEDYKKFILV
ncbi:MULTISPECIES: NTP transferase domain-containing protein [Clostridium]|uniref:NTP transferase domain-containing protein n=1 Tax=Clostridium TaxID=1485 RepID=UPI001896CEDC|nr:MULTISPECIES: NTP transferase domain-containing protein [Clostridium]MCR1952585.1 NTP transferase domain-containing protein [Clostridium sp. DSM 100503]MDI9215362.1 NTP transferase domain-containing protein [Clostridium tertium]